MLPVLWLEGDIGRTESCIVDDPNCIVLAPSLFTYKWLLKGGWGFSDLYCSQKVEFDLNETGKDVNGTEVNRGNCDWVS